MILAFHRNEPVRFSAVQKALGWIYKSREALRNSLFRRHGPKALSQNLLAELGAQTAVYWDRCDRTIPENDRIDALWVVNGANDLRWAIRNKERLKARRLWAGPNIAVVPQEEGGALLSHAIDRFMAPCQWVADFYRHQAPNLRDKIHLWPVGVDTDFWKPAAGDKPRLLIYNKNQTELCRRIAQALDAASISYKVIHYGTYTREEYRKFLKTSWGMIWLSESETEGLAALEALCMNVPIIAWNPGRWSYTSRELGQSFSCPSSSVPYFDARCGEIFEKPEEFADRLALFQKRLGGYRPRQFVLESHLDLASNLNAWGVFNDL